jgi:dynein heavy chain 1
VKKAAADLELSLLHLQQDIDIPEINLSIHPTVKQTLAKATKEGRRATVQDFGDKVEDSQFLNALQKGVTRWIREMQKITQLDRDPSSGSALQEISFWLNLERALHIVKDKRDSPEIAMTLDILKHGKRFHATVRYEKIKNSQAGAEATS